MIVSLPSYLYSIDLRRAVNLLPAENNLETFLEVAKFEKVFHLMSILFFPLKRTAMESGIVDYAPSKTFVEMLGSIPDLNELHHLKQSVVVLPVSEDAGVVTKAAEFEKLVHDLFMLFASLKMCLASPQIAENPNESSLKDTTNRAHLKLVT